MFDQAIPSGASMASLACLRLAGLADESYAEPATAYLEMLAPAAADDAFALGQTVCVLDRLVRGSVDVAVVGDAGSLEVKKLCDVAFGAYLPNRAVAVIDPKKAESAAAVRVLSEGKTQPGSAAVAYVCRGRTCSAPVSDAVELEKLLQ